MSKSGLFKFRGYAWHSLLWKLIICTIHYNFGIFKLSSPKGYQPGYFDSIILSEGRLFLTGWSEAENIIIKFTHTDDIDLKPFIHRSDIIEKYGLKKKVGFAVNVPINNAWPDLKKEIEIVQEFEDSVEHNTIRLQVSKRKLGLQVIYVFFEMLRQLNIIFQIIVLGNTALKKKMREHFNLEPVNLVNDLAITHLLNETFEEAQSDQQITVIVPVYNAYELVFSALDKVVENTDVKFRLIIIEDQSTDHRVRPKLRKWVANQVKQKQTEVHLMENDINLGFVGAVNKGLNMARQFDDHVVLLNSDAFVPSGWASRIVRPFTFDSIATVTPMSNDAEIFNVPLNANKMTLNQGVAEQIDIFARLFDWQAAIFDAPTGVGFCMAINAKFLKQIGEFDAFFAPGYGEEVDWCQKVRKINGRNVGIANLFVEHRSGSSFGDEKKKLQLTKNNKEISRRYPLYDKEVADFFVNDPVRQQRFALTCPLSSIQDNLQIFIAHSLGGGAEEWLKGQIKSATSPCLILRVGGTKRWTLSLYYMEQNLVFATDDFQQVEALFKLIKRATLTYSCSVGENEPLDLVEKLNHLLDNGNLKLQMLFHDYFPISPSYNLLQIDGKYHGIDALDYFKTSNDSFEYYGKFFSQKEWFLSWLSLIEKSDKIITFSQNSYQHLARLYPQLADRIDVSPHQVKQPTVKWSARDDKPQSLAFLGNINYAKGAHVIQNIAQNFGEIGWDKIVLIGNIDPNYVLPEIIQVTGTYEKTRLAEIFARYNVATVVIPSIWPETFCYTAHEAASFDVNVVAFDIGAHGDFLKQASNGSVVDMGSNPSKAMLENLKKT